MLWFIVGLLVALLSIVAGYALGENATLKKQTAETISALGAVIDQQRYDLTFLYERVIEDEVHLSARLNAVEAAIICSEITNEHELRSAYLRMVSHFDQQRH